MNSKSNITCRQTWKSAKSTFAEIRAIWSVLITLVYQIFTSKSSNNLVLRPLIKIKLRESTPETYNTYSVLGITVSHCYSNSYSLQSLPSSYYDPYHHSVLMYKSFLFPRLTGSASLYGSSSLQSNTSFTQSSSSSLETCPHRHNLFLCIILLRLLFLTAPLFYARQFIP